MLQLSWALDSFAERMRDLEWTMAADEISRIKFMFKRCDSNGDGLLDPDDIARLSQSYGRHINQKKASNMIWELDNNGDGKIGVRDVWDALARVRADRSATEPDELINLLEFAMYDPAGSGTISCEECMLSLSKRFAVHFDGADVRKFVLDTTITPDNRLDYHEFLRQISARKMLHFMK